MTLFGPGFSGDEDVIKAVGEPMLGMFNTSQWAHDLDNAANKKFVADFEKDYGRLPTLYAAQGYDAARLMDAAVRDIKGKLSDKAALRKALAAAKFDSVRGAFKFNSNDYPDPGLLPARDHQGRPGPHHQPHAGHGVQEPRRCLCGQVQDARALIPV